MIKKITSSALASLCMMLSLTNSLYSVYASEETINGNQIVESDKHEKSEDSSLRKKIICKGGSVIIGVGAALGLSHYLFQNSSNEPTIEPALPKGAEKELRNIFFDTYRKIDKSKINPYQSKIFALKNGMGISFEDTIIDLPRSNKGGNKCEFVVESGRSFAVVKRLINCGFINNDDKIAVLNFANYYTPGGGVIDGCKAQEESLCRISTLYAHLEKLRIPFYENNIKNKIKGNRRAGDRGIYTKNVIQLKQDTSLPSYKILPKEERLITDVLTVAAPDLRFDCELKHNSKKLKDIMVNRIKLTVAMAIKNKVDVLVLGALGCGAFGVNPEVCADAYYEVLVKEGYASYFKKVVFPILVVEGFENDKNNYRIFAEKFHGLTVK